jgi:hypothetical protein
MRKLDSSFNPTSMEKKMVIETNNEGKEVAKQVHFVFLTGSDYHQVPESIDEALYGPEKDKCWTVLAASDIMNFVSWKCWKKVPGKKVPWKTQSLI